MSALQDERQKLAARMTPKAARLLLDLPLLRVRRLEEMRFYAGQNACFIFDGRSETQHAFFSRQDVDELVTALCGYSRYAYETQLAQGFRIAECFSANIQRGHYDTACTFCCFNRHRIRIDGIHPHTHMWTVPFHTANRLVYQTAPIYFLQKLRRDEGFKTNFAHSFTLFS